VQMQLPRHLDAVVCDVCGCTIVQVDLAISAATIAPMVNAYGVPLCMKCADKLGFIISHYAHRALAGVQVSTN